MVPDSVFWGFPPSRAEKPSPGEQFRSPLQWFGGTSWMQRVCLFTFLVLFSSSYCNVLPKVDPWCLTKKSRHFIFSAQSCLLYYKRCPLPSYPFPGARKGTDAVSFDSSVIFPTLCFLCSNLKFLRSWQEIFKTEGSLTKRKSLWSWHQLDKVWCL